MHCKYLQRVTAENLARRYTELPSRKIAKFRDGLILSPLHMKDSTFRKTVLPDGLRVLTEHHPHVHSATIGLWFEAGAVYENKNQSGLAHLLEHMVFKGTHQRTSAQIAELMDSIGGQTNAFTDREFVCYHAKTLSEHAPIALELLCELATSSLLEHDDLELEKGVIIEEIRSIDDVPEDLADELFSQTIYPRSRWGRPITGSEKTVSRFAPDDLRAFMQTHYAPRHTLVVAVGDVEHEKIVEQAQKLLENLPGRDSKTGAHRMPSIPEVRAQLALEARDVEQVHLCAGTRAYAHNDPRRFAAYTLDTILTGGYSSRLFQEIREKRGLCYSIGSNSAQYRRGGFWGVATSVAPENAHETAELIARELRDVKAHGVKEDELVRANQMARANLLLAEESSSSQMGRIARNEWYYGHQRSTQDVLDDILGVTREEIQSVAQEMFVDELMNVVAVGPFEDGHAALEIKVG